MPRMSKRQEASHRRFFKILKTNNIKDMKEFLKNKENKIDYQKMKPENKYNIYEKAIDDLDSTNDDNELLFILLFKNANVVFEKLEPFEKKLIFETIFKNDNIKAFKEMSLIGSCNENEFIIAADNKSKKILEHFKHFSSIQFWDINKAIIKDYSEKEEKLVKYIEETLDVNLRYEEFKLVMRMQSFGI